MWNVDGVANIKTSPPTRTVALWLPLVLTLACGSDGGGGPTAPSVSATSVSVTFPAGETIFIGDEVQFEATETLSNGTTRVATDATWSSDNPSVATVSATGLVTAVAAGEATIFADVNPRGTRRIRVFPEFEGVWVGTWTVTDCRASAGLSCGGGLVVGGVTGNRATFTQDGATVTGDIRWGNLGFLLSGSVTIGGELRLDAEVDPDLATSPNFIQELRKWRSRADTPGEMTGTYERHITFISPPGSITAMGQLTLNRTP